MKKYTDVKTFEDACQVENLDSNKILPDFNLFLEEDREGMIAHAKLVIIARALNRLANKGKQWKPDWNNGEWDKYYPWFYMGGSAGFRSNDCGRWFSRSGVGSRLCYISWEVAKYAGEQFTELYKKYFTN